LENVTEAVDYEVQASLKYYVGYVVRSVGLVWEESSDLVFDLGFHDLWWVR